jgi:hypothetical protein
MVSFEGGAAWRRVISNSDGAKLSISWVAQKLDNPHGTTNKY